MNSDDSQTYAFGVNYKNVTSSDGGKTWTVVPAGTPGSAEAYSAAQVFADVDAALDYDFSTLTATSSGGKVIPVLTGAEGNYIVIMTESFGDIAYYAYYLTK